MVAAMVLAALLRFPGIESQSLWIDEYESWEQSLWPVAPLLTVDDGQPPLFPLLMKGVCGWLGTDACGRYVSAVFGVATVGLVVAVGTMFFGRRTGVFAGALLAGSPLHVFYSGEGRMYALLAFWSVLSWMLLWRAVRREGRTDWFAFALATIGGLLTHYTYAGLIAAQMIALGLVARRQGLSVRPALWAVVAVAAGLTLGLSVFDELLQGPIAPRRSLEILALGYTGFTFVAGFGMGPSVADLHRGLPWEAVLAHWPEVAAVGVLGLLLATAGQRSLWSGGVSNIYLAAWAFIPPLIAFGVSAASGVTYNVRYSIASLPAFALLSARGLLSLPSVARVLLCLALVAVTAISILRMRSHPDYMREDLRAAGAFLGEAARDGDRVVVSARYLARLLGHYYPDGGPIDPLPTPGVAVPHDAEKLFHALAIGPGSVWLVLSREWDDDPRGLLRAELAARRIRPAFEGKGVTVYAIRSSSSRGTQ
jgi:hypothetical protein